MKQVSRLIVNQWYKIDVLYIRGPGEIISPGDVR
jgi:hypothetical protein